MKSIVRRLPRWLALAIVGMLAVAFGVGFALWDRSPADTSALLALSLPDTQGALQPLRQWQGKVLVVNFWATWCEPCREEMPEFVRAQRELGPKGVQFVGIAVDQRDKVVQFAKELQLNYPALIGGYAAMDLSKPLGNRLLALPFTVILDRDGRIAHTQLGPLKPSQLHSIIDKLV
ncbi:MAG TPA: TlpA disulfide reductase family protein [Casimicrobiaceae bacterium]|nr:TlpA disulfide reductase family protein [Casimicrobiaceae bacterium]